MRASVIQGGTSAATLSKLTEKKKEYDAVSALERASALYLERLEALGDDYDVMADAGEGKALSSHSLQQLNDFPVHGQVLAQWPKMFQILSQFCTHWIVLSWCFANQTSFLVLSKDDGGYETNDHVQPLQTEGQRLIRVPIETLQEANADKS